MPFTTNICIHRSAPRNSKWGSFCLTYWTIYTLWHNLQAVAFKLVIFRGQTEGLRRKKQVTGATYVKINNDCTVKIFFAKNLCLSLHGHFVIHECFEFQQMRSVSVDTEKTEGDVVGGVLAVATCPVSSIRPPLTAAQVYYKLI